MSNVSAAATGLPAAIPSLARSMPRRGFLAGLTALPLLGGSVALLGRPHAVAEPVTPDMLEAYKTWLDHERRFLVLEMGLDPVCRARYSPLQGPQLGEALNRSDWQIGERFDHVRRGHEPSTRAALVLSTVGCCWQSDAATLERRA